MSNGHACCILGVCCPPLKQQEVLAAKIRGSLSLDVPLGKDVPLRDLGLELARELLSVFDLAPKGLTEAVKAHWNEPGSPALADAVRAFYAPLFAEVAEDNGKNANAQST